MQSRSFSCEIAGRVFTVETGKLATQANGSVTLRYGDTVVLVTACVGSEPREGIDFLPFTVDYEERLYAVGKIPGGFIRREGRPTQEATLAARLTDRPLRPLLPKSFRNEIQVIITVLSVDLENDPDILAVIGGSAALSMSEVPFDGPVSAVRVGYIDGKLVLNPTMPELENSQLDLIVASTRQEVVMLEAGASEISEAVIFEAVKFGHEANQKIIELQEELKQYCGKPKMEVPADDVAPDLLAAVSPLIEGKLDVLVSEPDKETREQAAGSLKKKIIAGLGEQFSEKDISAAFEKKLKETLRASILDKGQRAGGRGLTDIRSITCEVGLLPRTHGSALFTRGQTQVLAITTLGSVGKEQQLDGLGLEESKRFMHHYNFPPFSTGETKRIGVPGRREIGHGALAERAILPVLPKDTEFPYTIRLVSEVLSSSGSTSMASTCASSLSLMDAGIPIKRAVAGVAIGLITGEDGRYAILTDIEGIEDAYGDMDFKVAGTSEGITAIQMDTKLKGLSMEIIGKTLNQARDARMSILGIMNQTIGSSRAELNRYAPRMHMMSINPDKIGAVIGPGGKTIRSIISETKATIDIEDDGTVIIGSPDETSAQKAIEMIEGLTREVEVGVMYTGKVTRILNFGAMVEVLPGKEGLVHISELADYRVSKVEDVVKVGDEITVKAIGIDNMGRVNLSRRAVFEEASGAEHRERPPARRDERPGGPRDNRPPQRPRY